MTTNQSQRKRFEAAITAPPYELGIERWPDTPESAWPGSYKKPSVDFAWCVWRDCEKAAVKRCLELCKDTGDCTREDQEARRIAASIKAAFLGE